MVIFRACFIAAYLALLIAYFFSETSGNFTRRAVNKIAMATLFLACGYAWFFLGGSTGWRYLALAAMFFAWLGDVLLLWSFVAGGASFSLGNILFIIYMALLMKEAGVTFAAVWWVVPLFAVLVGMVFVLSQRKWINFGRLTLPLLAYMTTVTGHGVLGAGLASSVAGMHALLLGVGLVLFLVSDYFLMVYKFKYRRNAVLRLNSGTYFFGMMLVALSFSV